MGNPSSWFFPDPPRTYRGMRWVKIVLRAIHVLCAGVLTGAYLIEAATPQRESALIATAITGVLLLATDLYESAAFLAQVRGAIVLLKLTLLVLLPVLPAPGLVLAGILVGSVISSHAPSAVRYHMLLGRGCFGVAGTMGLWGWGARGATGATRAAGFGSRERRRRENAGRAVRPRGGSAADGRASTAPVSRC